jgi:hypothetical protein
MIGQSPGKVLIVAMGFAPQVGKSKNRWHFVHGSHPIKPEFIF